MKILSLLAGLWPRGKVLTYSIHEFMGRIVVDLRDNSEYQKAKYIEPIGTLLGTELRIHRLGLYPRLFGGG